VIRRKALKRRDRGIPEWVRKAVKLRSRGWCEVKDEGNHRDIPGLRATDLHHLIKRPRLHHPSVIVHLCRRHHDMCEAAYARGRLCFSASGIENGLPTVLLWRIEVRQTRDAALERVLGSGRIQV